MTRQTPTIGIFRPRPIADAGLWDADRLVLAVAERDVRSTARQYRCSARAARTSRPCRSICVCWASRRPIAKVGV